MQPTRSFASRTILRAAATTLATVVLSLPAATASDATGTSQSQEGKDARLVRKGTQWGPWYSTAPENPEHAESERKVAERMRKAAPGRSATSGAWDSTVPENPEHADVR